MHHLLAQSLDFRGQAVSQQLPYATTNAVSGFNGAFTTIMTGIMGIGVILVLFFLIMGGLDWIMSGGEKGKVESARNKITGAVIGLIVLASTFAILMMLQNFLHIQIFGSSTVTSACQGSGVIISNGGTCCSGNAGIFRNGNLVCP